MLRAWLGLIESYEEPLAIEARELPAGHQGTADIGPLDVAGLASGCFDKNPVEGAASERGVLAADDVEGEGGNRGRTTVWFRSQGEGIAQDHEVLGGVEFTGEFPAKIGADEGIRGFAKEAEIEKIGEHVPELAVSAGGLPAGLKSGPTGLILFGEAA